MTKFVQKSSKLFGQLAHLLFSKTQLKICRKLDPKHRSPLEFGYIRFNKTKPPITYFSAVATLHLSLSLSSLKIYPPLSQYWQNYAWLFLCKNVLLWSSIFRFELDNQEKMTMIFFRFCLCNLKNRFLDIRTTFLQNVNSYFQFPLKEF